MSAAPVLNDDAGLERILARVNEMPVLPHVVFKVMEISGSAESPGHELEKAIVKEASAFELREIAIERGMKTLREDGIHKALQGITTLEEVLARTAE